MKKEYPDILKLEGEKWQNPDPATGKLGTRVPAEWLQTTEDSLKSLTLEMLEVLKAAGINPNELNNTQVRDAIQKMILEKAGTPDTITQSSKNSVTDSSHTHEITKATTAQAGIVQLTNTVSSAQDKAITSFAVNELQKALEQAIKDSTPVGTTTFYIGETAPNDSWLIMRGQKYDTAKYPELYAMLKSDTLPDGRGVALRGLDSGRGFDPARTLLSYQEDAMQKIEGELHLSGTEPEHSSIRSGAFEKGRVVYSYIREGIWGERNFVLTKFNSSLVTRTNAQNETVMKNLAFNIIIKVK